MSEPFTPLTELERGSFQTVLDDHVEDTGSVTRVVLASGKIAHEAIAKRDEIAAHHVAIVRVEQLYPWPADQIVDAIARYEHATEVIWVQEEPENMGAWGFVHNRLHALLRDDYKMRHVSRAEAGAPAAGSSTFHELEETDLLERAFA